MKSIIYIINKCTIKLKDGMTKEQIFEFKNEISLHASINDANSSNEEIERIARILDIIFSVIIFLNMFLCFFSLISSKRAIKINI